MSELPIYVCNVDTPEGAKDYVTCLPQDLVIEKGLPPEAIVGILLRPLEQGEPITPSVFARNHNFVDFLHQVIARRGPSMPGLVEEARRQGEGWVYIIDQRTRDPQGSVPPEDIIGVFEVAGGEVVIDSYHPSPKHQILSVDGFFRLDSELQSCLLDELETLASSAT